MLAKEAVKHLVDIYFAEEQYVKLKELYETWSRDENVIEVLVDSMENKRLKLKPEVKQELSVLFGDEESPYGLLNLVRRHIYSPSKPIADGIWQRLDDLDLSEQPDYYGDVIFAKIRWTASDGNTGWFAVKISRFFGYLLHVHDVFLDNLRAP